MRMTRVLDLVPKGATSARKVEVSIGVPAEDADGNWWSLLELRGFDEPYAKQIPGADAIQAVLSAAALVPPLVAAMAKGGRVTLEGSEDLGFPSAKP